MAQTEATRKKSTKSTRKPRTVKNAFVDIDSVTTPPGLNYTNWVSIAKNKLKERESSFLQMKTNQIAVIVNSQTVQIQKDNINFTPFALSKALMNNVMTDLFVDINEWLGVNVLRMKNQIATFRQYFIRSRKWWDQKKTKGYAEIFWQRIFEQIHQYVHCNITPKYGPNKCSFLFINILKAIFDATVQFPNTKKQGLINSTTMTISSELHSFFTKIHPLFDILNWIKTAKQTKENAALSNPSAPRQDIGKIVMNKIRSTLIILSETCLDDDDYTIAFPENAISNRQQQQTTINQVEPPQIVRPLQPQQQNYTLPLPHISLSTSQQNVSINTTRNKTFVQKVHNMNVPSLIHPSRERQQSPQRPASRSMSPSLTLPPPTPVSPPARVSMPMAPMGYNPIHSSPFSVRDARPSPLQQMPILTYRYEG